MTLTAIKCVSCSSSELIFNESIATCKHCGNIYTTSDEFPTPGGSIRIIIPLTIAIGQTLRQSGVLVGQCCPSGTTANGENPNKKLENNDNYLTILEGEEYQETKKEGFILSQNITTNKVRYIKICYIYIKGRSVTFFVQGQKNMSDIREIAREITSKFDCNCLIILDKE